MLQRISDLPDATTPLVGTELVELSAPDGLGGYVSKKVAAFFLSPAQPKIYRALVSQSGTGAPTSIILENTLGAVPVWSYNGSGVYALALDGAFPVAKTASRLSNPHAGGNFGAVGFITTDASTNAVVLNTYSILDDGPQDGWLDNSFLEILVYP